MADKLRGFTLVELLVVISIIIFLLALAVPGISAFMKGRKLYNLGRLIESKFQRARMATVKTHIRHRLVLFQDSSEPQDVKYGLRIFQEGIGYADDQPLFLPKGTKFATDVMGPDATSALPVNTQPPTEAQVESDFAKAPLLFQPNGTLVFEPPTGDLAPDNGTAGADLYDRNKVINSVPRDTRADLVVLQKGNTERLYVDVDRRTGRARFRVVKTTKVEGGTP